MPTAGRSEHNGPWDETFSNQTSYCLTLNNNTHCLNSVAQRKSTGSLLVLFRSGSVFLVFLNIYHVLQYKLYICTLYLSFTQGAIPSQSLVSISDTSWPNFTSNQPASIPTLSFVLQQHGLCSVLTLWLVHMGLVGKYKNVNTGLYVMLKGLFTQNPIHFFGCQFSLM